MGMSLKQIRYLYAIGVFKGDPSKKLPGSSLMGNRVRSPKRAALSIAGKVYDHLTPGDVAFSGRQKAKKLRAKLTVSSVDRSELVSTKTLETYGVRRGKETYEDVDRREVEREKYRARQKEMEEKFRKQKEEEAALRKKEKPDSGDLSQIKFEKPPSSWKPSTEPYPETSILDNQKSGEEVDVSIERASKYYSRLYKDLGSTSRSKKSEEAVGMYINRDSYDSFAEEGFKVVNGVLRGQFGAGDEDLRGVRQITRGLDAGMRPVPHDLTLYRGSIDGPTPKIGGTFTDQAFVSTTVSPDIAIGYSSQLRPGRRILYEIEVPKGTRALAATLPNSDDETDSEVILSRGLTYQVTGKGDTGQGVEMYYLKIVPTPSQTPKKSRKKGAKT